jgi:hypothetical protein
MNKTAKRNPVRRAKRAEAKEVGPKPDPIFAAINQHRTALMARWAAFGAYGEIAADDPSYNKAEVRAHAAMDREHEALKALVACQPTTVNGLMVLLAYVGQPADGRTMSATRPKRSSLVRSKCVRSPLRSGPAISAAPLSASWTPKTQGGSHDEDSEARAGEARGEGRAQKSCRSDLCRHR